MMLKSFHTFNSWLFKEVSIAPLVVLRIAFGVLLLFSTLRSLQKGWVEELYIEPHYHFHFFEWLTVLEGNGMYYVFVGMAISATCIILGLFYRLNTIGFFLLFTYVELIDKAYYLNHYYLVSLLTFWLCLAPAHRWYSLDILLFPKIKSNQCPQWYILIFKVQLSIVYFFAGLAKVNPDWLLRAQPLASWLPGRYQIPIIGQWLHIKEVAFLFSWMGCLYDLFIWIFLWMKKSRGIAYFFVLVFHILTAILFPRIGMFPFIMITSTLIFFSASWHEKVLSYLPFYRGMKGQTSHSLQIKHRPIIATVLLSYFMVQLALPLRHWQYSGNLFWHEQGYRFSWRVMLMEKNGFTEIILLDPKSGIQKEIKQEEYLTAFQRQQMRSQPDMIFQFAKHIGDEFYAENGYAPEVHVKSRLSLNGKRSQPFSNDTLDFYALTESEAHSWIISYKPA